MDTILGLPRFTTCNDFVHLPKSQQVFGAVAGDFIFALNYYQFVSPTLLFLAYSISIFSLLIFFLSFFYNCTGSAFLFLCDLGLHLETLSLLTWKLKLLVGVTTLQEEEGNKTQKEAVTSHLLFLHLMLKWTGNRHEESP